MNTYDYYRTTRMHKNGICIVVCTYGLLNSRIFRAYEPLSFLITNDSGDLPFYRTHVNVMNGALAENCDYLYNCPRYVFLERKRSVEDMDKEARLHHRMIVAQVKTR